MAPSTAELLLAVAPQRGCTRYGESYAAAHLCGVARHFGYRSRLHRSASPPAPHSLMLEVLRSLPVRKAATP